MAKKGADVYGSCVESQAPGARRVSDIVNELGFGCAQIQTAFLGGGVYLADGAELLLIGAVTRAVKAEWGLSGFQCGLIVTVVFMGVSLGNIVSGHIGDIYGRRTPVLYSYALLLVFSLLSSVSWCLAALVVFRILVGFAFGLGVPAWNAAAGEFAPAQHRLTSAGLSQALFVVGEVYAAFLLYSDDKELLNVNWRWVVAMGAIPAAILLPLAYLYLPETPYFLASQGRLDEAKKVLEWIRHWNSKPGVSVECTQNVADTPRRNGGLVAIAGTSPEALLASDKLAVIFGPELRQTTCILCFSTFVLNFNFYGGLYAFPQVLPSLHLSYSPAVSLMLGAVMELPGFIMTVLFLRNLARRVVLGSYLLATSLSIMLFLYGAGFIAPGDSQNSTSTFVGFLGLKASVAVGFLFVYVYSAEVYPTAVRASGTAICIAAGRMGAMVAPLAYEILSERGDMLDFFSLVCSLCFLNFMLVLFLPYETAGMQMDEIEALVRPKAESEQGAAARESDPRLPSSYKV